MNESQRQVIVAVEDETLLSALHEQFHDERYELVFARDADEAIAVCQASHPRLVAVPVRTSLDDLLVSLARVRRDGTFILGVAPTQEERVAAQERQELYDWVVASTNREALCQAAREVLGDRRLNPRINLRFPIRLAGDVDGLVVQVSANALEIETEADLRSGKAIEVEIPWGPSRHRFMSLVIKVEPTVFYGRSTAVLLVHSQETGARRFLGELARLAVGLKRLLVEDKADALRLRGSEAWQLTRRAEALLRGTHGVTLDYSGDITLDTEACATTSEVEYGSVESRYIVERDVGIWGVGMVSLARHRFLGRQVLLKTLLPHLVDDASARRQLEHEARFSSPNERYVADVLDFDGDYYAMEVLQGETLADSLSSGLVLDPLETTCLGLHLVEALSPLHLHGLGHFDLCPENVFLHRPKATTVLPVLINFGATENWGELTSSRVIGASYRPPDARGRGPARDFDVYAVASILLEILAASRARRSSVSPDQPPGERLLFEILEMGTAAKRVERYSAIDQLGVALREALDLLEAEAPPFATRLIDPLQDADWTSGRPTPVTGMPIPE